MDCRFAHGLQPCRQCFGPEAAAELRLGDWRLSSNPGYYGSATPRTFVLGSSKVAHQHRMVKAGDCDRVAFRADSALWAYAAHPSPCNGHSNTWTEGPTDMSSGRKRLLVQHALCKIDLLN